MLLYDKKEDSIDIYSIHGKKEELKKFRKSVLQRHKNDNLFYYLRTNNEKTIQKFESAKDIDYKFLDYENSTPLDVGTWSTIGQMKEISKYDLQTQQEVLEKYIEGDYDSLVPTRVFEFTWKDDLDCETHRLIKPEEAKVIFQNSHGNVWQISNMINLPRNLYLLQLLQQGRYDVLTSENISRQLQLFDIEYLKNIKLSDIQEMLSTGLVNETIESAIKKAETGSRILQKVKKK